MSSVSALSRHALWKTSHISPVPQKPCPKENNDYRPVTHLSCREVSWKTCDARARARACVCVCVIDKQHVSLCYVIAASFFLFDYSSQLTHLSYYLSNSAQVFRLAVPGLSLFVVCSFISLVQKIPVIFACMWTRIIRLFLRHVRSRLRGTLVRRKKEKKKLPPTPPPNQTNQTGTVIQFH